MNFYTVRDLRTETKSMFETPDSGNDIIITSNGKPAALMIDIDQENFDPSVFLPSPLEFFSDICYNENEVLDYI